MSELLAACQQAAVRGAQELRTLIQPNGKFIYQYPYPNRNRPAKKYNLLRHCGALWAMTTTARQIAEGDKFLEPILRSWQFLLRQYGRKWPNNAETTLLIWHGHAKLGANALALLGMSEYIRWLMANRLHADNTFTIENYIGLVMQAAELANGIYFFLPAGAENFFHKFEMAKASALEFESDYYTGEALFALFHWQQTMQLVASTELISTEYYQQTQNRLPEAFAVLQRLAAQNYGLEFQSHWMLYTVSEVITRMPALAGPELQQYLNNLVDAVLHDTSYRNRQQSTPIACRTEGLLAALAAYKSTGETGSRQDTMRQHIEENLTLQLQWVMPNGAVINGSTDNTVRIDYIQHNISAFNNSVLLNQEVSHASA